MRNLQGRGGAASTQPLLQQLQAAQNSPRQHAIFMKMLQETLALPPQGQATSATPTSAASVAAAAAAILNRQASEPVENPKPDPQHQQQPPPQLSAARQNSFLEVWRQSAGVGSIAEPEVPPPQPAGKLRTAAPRIPHEVRHC